MAARCFPVNLSLGDFFADYRSTSRVFVNRRMERVSDLEARVAEIFGIANFYLTSKDHQYLPSDEDIRIIGPEDSLRAIPKPGSFVIVARNQSGKSERNCGLPPKDPGCTDDASDCSNRERNSETNPVTQSVSACNSLQDNGQLRNTEQFRAKLNESNEMVVDSCARNEDVSDDRKIISCEKNLTSAGKRKHSKRKDEGVTSDSKSIFGNKGVTIKKLKTDVMCLDLPKRTNVVKSLIVRGSHSPPSNGTNGAEVLHPLLRVPEVKSVTVLENIAINNLGDKTVVSSVKSSTIRHVTSDTPTKQNGTVNDPPPVGPTKDSLLPTDIPIQKNHNSAVPSGNTDSTEPPSSMAIDMSHGDESVSTDRDCSSASELSNKRKRKRHRKHKHSADHASSFECNYSPITEEHVFRQPATVAAPAMHLKFDDDSTASCELERVVDQSPVMTKTLPRRGDTISFKILRMTENYNPEISELVIGRVLDFDQDTEDVHLKIIRGADQCQEPSGKFRLLEDGEEAQAAPTRSTFRWRELIEPRLLFP